MVERFVRDILHRYRCWSRRRRALQSPLLKFVDRGQVPEGTSSVDWHGLRFPGARASEEALMLGSGICLESQLASPAFRYWARALGLAWKRRRKLWEFCFICQALYERGMLSEGRRGLGFAVGEEPLPALFASRGCSIVATDLVSTDRRAQAWSNTAQLAVSAEKLERPQICDPLSFRHRVSFRPVDMNRMPQDLSEFDFTWSSCSFEHCGSIQLGLEFLLNQMRCLRAGGVAVHTTEFNLSSNEETVTEGDTVVFRKRDIDEVIKRLEAGGHSVEPVNYTLGSSAADRHIDIPPYADGPQNYTLGSSAADTQVDTRSRADRPHLKLLLADKFISTSIALIIRKRAYQ